MHLYCCSVHWILLFAESAGHNLAAFLREVGRAGV